MAFDQNNSRPIIQLSKKTKTIRADGVMLPPEATFLGFGAAADCRRTFNRGHA